MQTKKSLFRGNGLCRKRGLPSFRHYPLARGLGFLGLLRRPMNDYISYLLLNKIKFFLQFTFHDGTRMSFGAPVFGVSRHGA